MNWKTYLKYLPLPLLVAAYPILFLYGHNASSLTLGNLKFPLGASLLVAGAVYAIFCLFQRKPLTASLSAAAFLVLYYLYGSFYHLLVKLDRFTVYHFVLLPLVIALAACAAYLVSRIKPARAAVIQKVLVVVTGALVVFNLFAVTAPVEAQKILANKPITPVVQASNDNGQKKPDIYYIIFDEYSGFEAVRDYWHDDYMDQFATFLQQNHFFVATGSRSLTLNTGSEIASRLNLQPYPENLPAQAKIDGINNNKVMQVLKSYGYTTMVMDMAFQKINADITLQYDPEKVGGMASEEFEKTFLDTTMFSAFSTYFQFGDKAAVQQRDFILYSLNKTASLGKTASPKFVYTHVLLPHEPFIFDENGKLLPPKAADDWNYYLGQHKYTTKLAERLITQLLANADPNNPPVIIVQSDHGARNLATKAADGTILNNQLPHFPPQDMFNILNALYLPGFDTSQLSPTMNPTQTFAIVLNHYLNAEVRVDNNPVH